MYIRVPNIEKLDVSKQGNLIMFGGKGLNILQIKNSDQIKLGQDWKMQKYDQEKRKIYFFYQN